MTDLIKETLEEYFSDYKQYHLIILIVFALIIAVFQIFQSFWISKKMETFKVDLKKSELKFSRHHNLQVDALKLIYDKLVSFHIANTHLFKSKYDSNNHNQFKKRINIWIKTYFESINAFNREKILLPNNLKTLVGQTIKDFEEVKEILINERQDLLDLEDASQGIWEVMYDYADDELISINAKIDHLKTKDSIKNSGNDIKELRNVIEVYFEEMIK